MRSSNAIDSIEAIDAIDVINVIVVYLYRKVSRPDNIRRHLSSLEAVNDVIRVLADYVDGVCELSQAEQNG